MAGSGGTSTGPRCHGRRCRMSLPRLLGKDCSCTRTCGGSWRRGMPAVAAAASACCTSTSSTLQAAGTRTAPNALAPFGRSQEPCPMRQQASPEAGIVELDSIAAIHIASIAGSRGWPAVPCCTGAAGPSAGGLGPSGVRRTAASSAGSAEDSLEPVRPSASLAYPAEASPAGHRERSSSLASTLALHHLSPWHLRPQSSLLHPAPDNSRAGPPP